MIQMDMNMPKSCSDCPFSFRDEFENRYCRLLPILDMDGEPCGKFQKVSTASEDFKGHRSKHCPLKDTTFTKKLKHCDCGKAPILCNQFVEGEGCIFWIHCANCGNDTGWFSTPEEAIADWNGREK